MNYVNNKPNEKNKKSLYSKYVANFEAFGGKNLIFLKSLFSDITKGWKGNARYIRKNETPSNSVRNADKIVV